MVTVKTDINSSEELRSWYKRRLLNTGEAGDSQMNLLDTEFSRFVEGIPATNGWLIMFKWLSENKPGITFTELTKEIESQVAKSLVQKLSLLYPAEVKAASLKLKGQKAEGK